MQSPPSFFRPGQYSLLSIALCFSSLLPHFHAEAQDHTIDFRYAPSRYLTAIGFVDDWQKTLVSDKGGLAYDFGPGPYAQPLTEITVGIQNRDLIVESQSLSDPRVPIVTTVLTGAEARVTQHAFAIITDHEQSFPSGAVGRVRRIGGLSGTGGWVAPQRGVDPAFQSVAWGTSRPIVYRVSVTRGSRKRVVLGFCEPHKPRAGMRLLELRVEGTQPITIDPLKDGIRNRPSVYSFDASDADNDGELSIEVHPSPRTPDANVILNCFWVFDPRQVIVDSSLIRGEFTSRAEVYYACGQELERSAHFPRLDGILATVTKGDGSPVVMVRSRRALEYDGRTQILFADLHPLLVTRPAPLHATMTPDGIRLELPAHTKQVEVIVAHGPISTDTLQASPSLSHAQQRVAPFWLRDTRLPFDVIEVPDTGIRAVLDANIRNLYQIREWVDGGLQYQPGPTVYRGLWSGDVMLSGLAALMLGDTSSARLFLERTLQYQGPDGRVCSLEPVLAIPETPATVSAMCLYARFANDFSWVRSRWGALVRGLNWLCAMHQTTLADTTAPWSGLMPPGFVDGGIAGETADYASVWWTLIALENAVAMARHLGIPPEPQWTATYHSLRTRYHITAQRDMLRDTGGRPYLPIAVHDTNTATPTRGQFALLLPFRWGTFFRNDSTFLHPATASIAMLDAWTKEGLVINSGWLQGGVWPWLGGALGIAHGILGHATRAEELLYSYANHAAPTGVWVEEQQAREFGKAVAGDVSNAEASAVFISEVRDLIAQERGDTLDLFRVTPMTWLRPGAKIGIHGGGTLFGSLTVSLCVANDGRSAVVDLTPVDGRNTLGGVVMHLAFLRNAGFRDVHHGELPTSITVAWGKAVHLECRR